MMTEDVWQALAQVAGRIAELAPRDPELRKGLRALSAALYALTEPPRSADEPPPAEEPPARAADELPRPAEPAPTRAAEVPRKQNGTAPRDPNGATPDDVLPAAVAAAALTFAPPPAATASWQDFPAPPTDEDLPRVAARCRLKADGARWAAERERRIGAGANFLAEVAPGDREIIARARALDGCYLWMNSPGWVPPPELGFVEDLAGCFDVLADALDAVALVREADRSTPREAMELLAESQSALWAAVARLSTRPDPDQERAFIWLREETTRTRLFLPRHMRRDDPADPAAWRDRRERVARFAAAAGAGRDRDRQRRKLFKKLEYLAARAAAGDDDPDYARERFVAAADELLALGVPPSHPELCAPAAALFGPDVTDAARFSPAFQQVLREAERRGRLDQPDEEESAAPAEPDGPADVEEAVRRIEAEFPDAIAFALNARSQLRGNPFAEPARFYAALRFLATTYRDARLGIAPCPDLDAECRRQSGFWYRPHQSETAVGMFADDYRTAWRGRPLTLHSHLGKGISKDPRYTARVAFDFDDERGVVVVGFLGQHQRTRAT